LFLEVGRFGSPPRPFAAFRSDWESILFENSPWAINTAGDGNASSVFVTPLGFRNSADKGVCAAPIIFLALQIPPFRLVKRIGNSCRQCEIPRWDGAAW
jgi:hypothetical protein